MVETTEGPAEVGRYNTKLVIGVILGAFAIICLFFANLMTLLLGIAAVVLGHLGLREIQRSGERSHSLGVTTLALGYIATGLVLLFLLIGVVAVGSAASRSGNHDSCTWPTAPTKQQEQRCFDSSGQ